MLSTFIAVAMIAGGVIWFIKIWVQKGQNKEWEPWVAGGLIVLGAFKFLAGF